MKTLLLFDIDGTLLRADGATRRAINKTFGEIFGIENPEQNVPFMGRTDIGIFKDVALKLLGRPLQNGELRQVADRYVTLLPAELELCESFCLMPGVKQLLFELSRRTNVILGLETGNIEPAAYLKLKRGDIDRYFSSGGFGSDSEDRTELIRLAIERARNRNGDIPNRNIFVIGDSSHDISAGKNCGVNTIAVGTGRGDNSKLLGQSPSGFFPDLSDIPSFFKCIGL